MDDALYGALIVTNITFSCFQKKRMTYEDLVPGIRMYCGLLILLLPINIIMFIPGFIIGGLYGFLKSKCKLNDS